MPEIKTGADSLHYYLTGAASDGAAQASQAAALGNYRSSTRIMGLDSVVTNPIANITIDFISCESGIGDGSLVAIDADTIGWGSPADAGVYNDEEPIANGETKQVRSDTLNGYVIVTRTSASALTGTATVATATPQSNVIAMSDADGTENAAGSVKYRAIAIKNEAAGSVTNLKAVINPRGTQRVSGTTQLGASGAGEIVLATGNFNDWADSGFCRIETSADAIREIVYYSSRTSDTLTIPLAGRGLLGTSAAAGAATDKIYNVPGLRIAKDPNYPAQTIANENTAPTGVSWSTQENQADGINIGTVTAGSTVVLWLERTVIANSTAAALTLNDIGFYFDASEV